MTEDRKKGKQRFDEKMNDATEAPVHPDQKEVEAKLLATLATVINSDQADLKYDILDMDASDFHFRDHREIFAAMKMLTDAQGTMSIRSRSTLNWGTPGRKRWRPSSTHRTPTPGPP
jgi:hypothetical protein